MPHLGPLPSWSFALGVTTSLFSVLNPISAAAIFASATVAMQFLINGVKALYVEMQQAAPAAVISTK